MKKSDPCPPCNPCLNFCPSPKAYGHYIVTDIILFYDNQGICSLYKSCCYSANCHQPPPNLPRRGGTDSLGSSQTSGQAGFCLSPDGVCHIGDKWATSVQQTCPSGATCLPMLGNVLAQSGHAAYPGWADLLSDVCPIS